MSKTERMMPSDLGSAIGPASALACECQLEYDRSGVELAKSTGDFEPRFIEASGQGV